MSNRLLKQEEIDALLSQSVDPEEAAEEKAVSPAAQHQAEVVASVSEEVNNVHEQAETVREETDTIRENIETAKEETAREGRNIAQEEDAELLEDLLKDEEKDALGEIGNICMGSAATTLSMLLNQKVSITSPQVTITTIDELFMSFVVPHMSIFVRFIEGLSGYNLLIMRLADAAVLADLMMGGDGTSISEELTEIGVSAASEAMNQMIGTASTSLATMFSRTVNISPPETKVYHSTEDLKPPLNYKGPIVVVWFKMTVGSILDTQIMQVMGVDTAKEEAGLLLGQLEQGGKEEAAEKEQESEVNLEAAEALEPSDDFVESLIKDLPEPKPAQPTKAAREVRGAAAPNRAAFAASGIRADFSPAVATASIDQRRLNRILDIPLKVTVLLGRTRWPIKDILGITPGAIVELQNFVDEPVEVLVNGTPVAMGEVVVVNENFGVRITSIIEPEERLKNLRR